MMDSAAEKDVFDKDHKLNGELYRALLNEDEEKVIQLCELIDNHALHKLTIHNDTVLHKAAYYKQTDLTSRKHVVSPPSLQNVDPHKCWKYFKNEQTLLKEN